VVIVVVVGVVVVVEGVVVEGVVVVVEGVVVEGVVVVVEGVVVVVEGVVVVVVGVPGTPPTYAETGQYALVQIRPVVHEDGSDERLLDALAWLLQFPDLAAWKYSVDPALRNASQ
jgi:hypothetical protein